MRFEQLESRDVPAIIITSGDDSGPGTLRAAIANDPHTGGGVSVYSIDASSVSSILLESALPAIPGGYIDVINKPYSSYQIQIRRDENTSPFRLLTFAANPAGVSDIGFNNGYSNVNGGAIFAGDITLTHCAFSQNYSEEDGGAIAARSIQATNCDFYYNTAQGSGGAILIQSTGGAGSTFVDTNIVGNLAVMSSGGGVYADGNGGLLFYKTANSTRMTIWDNMAPNGFGGGVYTYGLVGVQFTGDADNYVTLQGNGALDGFGVYIYGSIYIHVDALVYGNVSTDYNYQGSYEDRGTGNVTIYTFTGNGNYYLNPASDHPWVIDGVYYPY